MNSGIFIKIVLQGQDASITKIQGYPQLGVWNRSQMIDCICIFVENTLNQRLTIFKILIRKYVIRSNHIGLENLGANLLGPSSSTSQK